MRRHSIGTGTAAVLIGALAVLTSGTTAFAAALPAGFAEVQVGGSMNNATAMTIAPDGRIFVSEQAGRLRLIKAGVLQAAPALTLTVDATNERGLLGTAFDPNFPSTPHIYIYYTRPGPGGAAAGAQNVVSRFDVVGDTVVAASEQVVLFLPPLGPAPIHNSGALHFAPDGTLFISVGENSFGPHSQNLNTLFGKLLRINKDGSIPADNPFYSGPGNVNGAIWAWGLRNPFTFDIQPTTGRIFVNDVGDKFWDEINDIKKGGNYGWPDTEGPHDNPAFEQSFLYIPWSPQQCTVIGAAFYNPAVVQFPQEFVGKYFHGDLCGGFIRVLDPATGEDKSFATGITGGNGVVDLDVGPDGMLYYLSRGGSANQSKVMKIFLSDGCPKVSVPPVSQLVAKGDSVTFTCEASGYDPMSWKWNRNGLFFADGGTGRSSSLTFTAQMIDDGAQFTCEVTGPGCPSVLSAPATLTVIDGAAPNAFITQPPAGSTYAAGTTLNFCGEAFDQEDGVLAPSAFTWEVVFDHGDHNHPAMPQTTGSYCGSYSIPTVGEQSTNVAYRIILRVTDSTGLVRRVDRVVPPQTTTLDVFSNPSGRSIKLDGVPKVAPFSLAGVVGMQRLLDIPSYQVGTVMQQAAEGSAIWYQFSGWSDGGATAHNIFLGPSGNEFTASFTQVVNPNCISPIALNRFINMPMASVQTGKYEIEFDVTPLAHSIAVTLGVADGVHGGLPYQTCTLGFSRAATGQTNGKVGPIFYFKDQTYRARIRVDFDNKLQSAYVTPPGGPEATVRPPTAFRAERQVDTSNNIWGAFVDLNPGTTARICNVELNCRSEKNTAPVINGLTADTTNIWPPNHRMVTVNLNYSVSDNCLSTTGTPFLVVTSNEADNGVAEEDEPGDIEIVDNKTVRVRAERADEGSGRVYTITVVAVDAAGLAGSSSIQVTVPHNQ